MRSKTKERNRNGSSEERGEEKGGGPRERGMEKQKS